MRKYFKELLCSDINTDELIGRMGRRIQWRTDNHEWAWEKKSEVKMKKHYRLTAAIV